ncbi:GNAT family N-acetyltransferase [Thauera sp. SDU_THAU2]|uniref:GNAT family N-acetyltransferase n=1 Tax=Thauera sp. SDU_THAU2 TaxID=3136633 RepID=UPI00311DE60E
MPDIAGPESLAETVRSGRLHEDIAMETLPRFVPADAPRILAHLLMLNADDRMLRFGYGIRDEGIAGYVARLDFARDHLHGLCAASGEIIALAHVGIRDGETDFGLSVTLAHRGRGLGHRLFGHVIELAKSSGAACVVCHSISPAVHHMAILHGFRRLGGKLTAPLTLPLSAGTETRTHAEPACA